MLIILYHIQMIAMLGMLYENYISKETHTEMTKSAIKHDIIANLK